MAFGFSWLETFPFKLQIMKRVIWTILDKSDKHQLFSLLSEVSDRDTKSQSFCFQKAWGKCPF